MDLSFFTTDPSGSTFFKNVSIGGIRARSSARSRWSRSPRVISIPIGVGVALWLVEYGKRNAFAQTVRFFVDVLTGVPSIIFGLFIYIVLIINTGGRTPATRARSRSRC